LKIFITVDHFERESLFYPVVLDIFLVFTCQKKIIGSNVIKKRPEN